MKKLFIFNLIGISLLAQGTTDPTQRLGPNGSVTPRVFFGSTPGNATGNKSGDFFLTPTGIYVCSAASGTASPACNAIGSANWQISATLTSNVPNLIISMSHSGNFTQGQVGATYTITVTNNGTAATTGAVSTTLTTPTGLQITSLSGSGWTCSAVSGICTRSDALAISGSYPAISEVVTVAANASTPLVNSVNVSGGGMPQTTINGTTDSTTIMVGGTPQLSILLSHTGNFSQGQTGATSSIVVSNVGGATTSGTVTVTDTLPTGLTATAMSGTGWSCTFGTRVCTRSSALAASASYPTITITFNVASSSNPSLTNSVTVSGGGASNTPVSSDPITITGTGIPVSDAFPGSSLNPMWTVLNPAGGTVTVSSAQVHLVVPGAANHDPTDSGMDQSLRISQSIGNVSFQATAEFDTVPSMQYQFEGFFAKQDTNMNFMRFQFGSDGTTLHCNANVVLAGVETDPIDTAIAGSPTKLWMQVTRQGDTWSQDYSTDGVAYTPCGSATQVFTIDEFDIWAGNFGTPAASNAPAFTALVANFVGTVAPGGGGTVTCTTVMTTSSNIQTVVNASTAGQTLCFAPGTYSGISNINLKAGVTYAGQGNLGQAVLDTSTNYAPIFNVIGSNIVIQNLVFNGGGIVVTGTTTGLNVNGNLFRNISSPSVAASFGSAGIFQNYCLTCSVGGTITNNQFLNITNQGSLDVNGNCNGVFPTSGDTQPCDWQNDGIDVYFINNLSVTHNTFTNVFGDAMHLFQPPGACQGSMPNLVVSNNTITNTRRLPLEFQACGMVNPIIDHNIITQTWVPSAGSIAISFAGDATGARITNNYIDGASNHGQGFGSNIEGTCFETSGTATVVDSNFCTTTLATGGVSYYSLFSTVFENAEAFSNNQYCGPSVAFVVYDTNKCGSSGASCTPFTETNDKYTASCAGFPPVPSN